MIHLIIYIIIFNKPITIYWRKYISLMVDKKIIKVSNKIYWYKNEKIEKINEITYFLFVKNMIIITNKEIYENRNQIKENIDNSKYITYNIFKRIEL
jgi:hypothetical protein